MQKPLIRCALTAALVVVSATALLLPFALPAGAATFTFLETACQSLSGTCGRGPNGVPLANVTFSAPLPLMTLAVSDGTAGGFASAVVSNGFIFQSPQI